MLRLWKNYLLLSPRASSSGQIQYIDLSGADSVEVYAAGGAAALNGFTEKAESLWAYVLEYFR